MLVVSSTATSCTTRRYRILLNDARSPWDSLTHAVARYFQSGCILSVHLHTVSGGGAARGNAESNPARATPQPSRCRRKYVVAAAVKAGRASRPRHHRRQSKQTMAFSRPADITESAIHARTVSSACVQQISVWILSWIDFIVVRSLTLFPNYLQSY